MAELDDILKERGGRYGDFHDNAAVAQLLKHAIRNTNTIPIEHAEALDQICSKISRIVTGDPNYVDNWDDIAGYATLIADRLRKYDATAKKA